MLFLRHCSANILDRVMLDMHLVLGEGTERTLNIILES